MVGELLQLIGTGEAEYANTPATTNLFEVDEGSEPLADTDRMRFHSATALALYMAKRARPDLLTTVSYLSTRVTKSTVDDYKKLKRMGAYLNSTKDLKLSLSAEGELFLTSYVDASYGVHPDGKSNTGGTDTLGKGSFNSTSSKQTIVCKSSSEAELVGISDRISPLIGHKNFLEAQGHKIGPIKLHQDNRSTITMAKKGKPINKKTRHIAIRYFFIKDRIEMKEVELINTGTQDMLADYFTKPLQGALFKKMRDLIMNIT
jgi:hypothetical protein